MNALAGLGVLSMPFALAQSGWMGLCVLLLFAALAFYTGVLLCRCMDLDRDIRGYPDVGYAAFGKYGRLLISGMLYGEQANFLPVLMGCFVLCTLLYGGMAIVAYLMFGDDIESQVTLNLPKGSLATTIAIVATLVNPAAKYALILTPVATALDGVIPQRWQSYTATLVLRTLLVISTTVVALSVPFFAYIMALIGSLLTMSMGIIVPCICYVQLFSHSITLWEKTMILLLAFGGLVACVAGPYTSVLQIVVAFSQA